MTDLTTIACTIEPDTTGNEMLLLGYLLTLLAAVAVYALHKS